MDTLKFFSLLLTAQMVLAHDDDDINYERTWYAACGFIVFLLAICVAWWLTTSSPFYDLIPLQCDDNVINVRIVEDSRRP